MLPQNTLVFSETNAIFLYHHLPERICRQGWYQHPHQPFSHSYQPLLNKWLVLQKRKANQLIARSIVAGDHYPLQIFYYLLYSFSFLVPVTTPWSQKQLPASLNILKDIIFECCEIHIQKLHDIIRIQISILSILGRNCSSFKSYHFASQRCSSVCNSFKYIHCHRTKA